MFKASEIDRNTVSAINQVTKYVRTVSSDNDGLRILFVGNSITLHSPNESIGWYGDWGMAASCEANDYVHRVVSEIEKTGVKVGFAIASTAFWELGYDDPANLSEDIFGCARDFGADIVIVRLAENIKDKKMSKVELRPYFEDMVRFFISDKTKQVIVTDSFWRRDIVDIMIKDICDKEGYTFCKLSDLYDDKKTMALGQFAHEGVSLHPSDYGMEKIAERILEVIKL